MDVLKEGIPIMDNNDIPITLQAYTIELEILFFTGWL